jgi:hypothetical protein
MANGFHRSRAEWQRVEKPLQALDERLDEFAKRYGMALTRNDKDSPCRSIRWGDRIKRHIAIYVEDVEQLGYSMCFSAVEIRGSKRYWKREFPKQRVPIGELNDELLDLLERGRLLLNSWESEHLVAIRRSFFPWRRA